MLKILDVNTKSVTEAKKEFSKIIKDINHNKPEAVIFSNTTYEELVKRNRVLEEKLFYSQLNNRVKDGPGELIPSEKVIESNQENNPCSALSNKDLFD